MLKKLENDTDELDARYTALCARRDALVDALSTNSLSDQAIEDMLEFRADVEAGLLNPTVEDLRRWLELLQVEVVVGGGMATITCRLPTPKSSTHLTTSRSLPILVHPCLSLSRPALTSEPVDLATTLFSRCVLRASVVPGV